MSKHPRPLWGGRKGPHETRLVGRRAELGLNEWKECRLVIASVSFTSAHPSVGAGWLLRPRIYFVTRSLVLTPVQSSTRCITLGKLLMFVPSFLFCNKKKIVMYNLLVLILCLELREVLNTQMSN